MSTIADSEISAVDGINGGGLNTGKAIGDKWVSCLIIPAKFKLCLQILSKCLRLQKAEGHTLLSEIVFSCILPPVCKTLRNFCRI